MTGAAQGIGRVYAERLAADGYRVALADVDAGVVRTAEEIRASDADCVAFGVTADVADPRSIDNAVRTIAAEIGPPQVLVNNAALFAALPLVGWDEISLDMWDRVMAVNLRGPFLCCQAVLPAMIERGWGRIINISSTAAHVGSPGRLHYTASKAGVIGLTRALAREVGDAGITVNAVAPGGTESEGTLRAYSDERRETIKQARSIKRAQIPGDLAGTVSFLASVDADFITGQTIVVDGGHVFT